MDPSKSAAGSRPAPSSVPAVPATPTSRLYRPVDWITFIVVTLVALAGYLYTIAPDLTLEDSGELAVGSMYAGVPHPPGYPVWTLYTWLFTKILPFSNIAWRVAVSSAVAAALSAGIVGLLVSRGSSMILESIDQFKNIDRRWENPICLVSGFVAGLLIAFNGFIWSQAVIVEVYTLAVLTLAGVLAALLRWTYAPQQRFYLYLALFLFGLCFCNHQTLIVAAMGIEVVVFMADRKVGRDMLLGNTAIWLLATLLHLTGKIATFQDNPALQGIFHLVGLLSLAGSIWLLIVAPKPANEWLRDFGFLGLLGLSLGLFSRLKGFDRTETVLPAILLVGSVLSLAGALMLQRATRQMHGGFAIVAAAGFAFFLGALFYFYMPVASATNPPMNWGYPRTWDGFIHAFTRGQYERTMPGMTPAQIWAYLEGVKEEFNWANILLGLVPFAFLKHMRSRERGWLIGLSAIYLCLAFVLLYLLNAGVDKQSRELVKVFFTSSHIVLALAVGYGLTLVAGILLQSYQNHRYLLLLGAILAVSLNLWELAEVYDARKNVFLTPRLAAIVSVALSVAFLGLLLLWRERARLAPVLAVFACIPLDSIISHWADNEQRGHLYGFWFGHDMFEPGRDAGAPAPKGTNGVPLYPPMDRHTVLFGGTDPGRFCPTYMIFCESFVRPEDRLDPGFDRRDVYIITQNALADNTYLDYIRAHYNRSAQNDPPFFLSWLNDARSMARGRTNYLAGLFTPLDRLIWNVGDSIERDRRVGNSWFTPADFKDLNAFRAKLAAASDPMSRHLKEKLGAASGGEASALAQGLNALLDGPSLYDPERFRGVTLSDHVKRFAAQAPQGHTRIRLNRLLLEEAYPDLLARSAGGLYPDREILTPNEADARRCFDEYTIDAQRRAQLKQLRPGEVLTPLPDGRVTVSGQAAVMAINGLLTKVIFDKNPGHAFYLEESFPLDWMYPHLTPYGIIMKIEREPVERLGEEQLQRDHEYWSQYSTRFIGNWIKYETPVQEVCDFALRTYKRRDLTGFQGDPKFVRDDNAQKAFSKLRNGIGKSVYAWRAERATDATYQQRLLKEAEFALKQAFAFCPFSPETVYNYASLLASLGRYRDAYDVVATAYAFDEDNAGIRDLLDQLERFKDAPAPPAAGAAATSAAAPDLQSLTTNLDRAFNTAAAWLQSGRSNEAMALLESMLQNPQADARTLLSLAQGYAQLARPDKMETALEKYARMTPDSAEAWYDLAAIQAAQGKSSSAASTLRKAFQMSDGRMLTNPAARNLRTEYTNDPRFNPVRPLLDLK